MCKCHNVELGGCKAIAQEVVEVRIGRKRLDDHLLTMWFHRTNEGQYVLESSYMGFDDDTFNVREPIRFCPFCGRELTPDIGCEP